MQTATEILNSAETKEQQHARFKTDPVIQDLNRKIAEMKAPQPKRIIAYENGPVVEEGTDESFLKAIDHLAQLRNEYISAKYPLLQSVEWFINMPE
jgi:hypothetical protein